MTEDIPAIWEQNYGFPSLQAHLTEGTLANAPPTHRHETVCNVIGIHFLCPEGVHITSIHCTYMKTRVT